jgi:hypothetical protein
MFVPSLTAAANSTATGKGAIVVQVAPLNLYDVAGIAPLLTPEKVYMLLPTVVTGSSRIGAGITGAALHTHPGLGVAEGATVAVAVGVAEGVPLGVGLAHPPLGNWETWTVLK